MHCCALQDQEGRSYAYPAADSRAGSFCSSGDSVDSHGTSAEGVDSEGEAHSPRQVGMNLHVAKKPTGAVRSGSHGFDLHSTSGSTSCSNSGVNSPNGSSANIFSTSKRTSNVPKVKGDLVRKRSRESLKSAAQGNAVPSPKKSNALESSYLKSKSGEIESTGRFYSAVPPTSQTYYNPSGYTSSGYTGSGYGTNVPGHLPQDDLRMGLGLDMVPDFYFPSSGFPEDPCASHYNPHLRTMSNDTDLTQHTPYYFGAAFGGSFGCAEGGEQDVDDDGLMHLLDKIDWEQEEEEAAHSTADNSRALSPVTDTASSVGSHARSAHTPHATHGHTAHVHLTNPVVPFALANLNNANKCGLVPDTAQPVSAATSTESVSSELSRLSAECTHRGSTPLSPASQAMSASIATGIAMGARAVHSTYSASNSNSTTSTASNAATAESELQPKHRLAFCSVIDELKLVTKVARSNSSVSMSASSGEESPEADHISLFDLFQRDGSGAGSVGRLPPLRSLVQAALARGVITADPVSTATLTANIATFSTNSVFKTEHTSNNASNATANALNNSGMDFDAHEFDFSSFMDDGFASFDGPSSSVASSGENAFDPGMTHMQFSVGSDGASSSHVAASVVSSGGASDGLFTESIIDNSGALTTPALLTHSMLPSAGKTATPSVVQRKRGRPRKYSISVPAAPVSTPSATTAKSLLSGPALAHALSTQQYQCDMTYASEYVVPVNATVLQAFNLAVSGSTGGGNGGVSGAEYAQNSRSYSGDHTYSLRQSPSASSVGSSHSNTSTYLSSAALSSSQHAFHADNVRLGLTRTMSSESDTMMANCFDPKLYDDVSYGVGMLEDFE